MCGTKSPAHLVRPTPTQPFEPRRPYLVYMHAPPRRAVLRPGTPLPSHAPSLLCSSSTYMTEPAHLRRPDRSLSAEKKVKRKCAAVANRKTPACQRSHLEPWGKTLDHSFLPAGRLLSSTLATETLAGSGAKALASRNSNSLCTYLLDSRGKRVAVPSKAVPPSTQVFAVLEIFSVLAPDVNPRAHTDVHPAPSIIFLLSFLPRDLIPFHVFSLIF